MLKILNSNVSKAKHVWKQRTPKKNSARPFILFSERKAYITLISDTSRDTTDEPLPEVATLFIRKPVCPTLKCRTLSGSGAIPCEGSTLITTCVASFASRTPPEM